MFTLAKMVDFPSFQNLYVIRLLCHGQIVEAQIMLHNKEHGNKARLCADFNIIAKYTL